MALVNVLGPPTWLQAVNEHESCGQRLAKTGDTILHHDPIWVGARLKGLDKVHDLFRDGVDFFHVAR